MKRRLWCFLRGHYAVRFHLDVYCKDCGLIGPSMLCACGHERHLHDPEAVPALCMSCGDADGCDRWVAREVWVSDPAPGGWVCAECFVPVESEPCLVHGPRVFPPEGGES